MTNTVARSPLQRRLGRTLTCLCVATMIFSVVCTSVGFAQKTASALARAARDGDSAALTQLIALANTGDASAQFNLGVMYENGLGVPKDALRAVSCRSR